MRRASPLDASYLSGETGSWHMHAGALVVLDPATAPEPLTADRVRELVRRRLPLLDPLRKRLVEVPLGLDRPLWVEDAEPDLYHHVRPVGVPAPGGPRQLADLVGSLFSYQLDRSRPLWELWVVDGLDDGRVAVLVKVHHALVDATRGAALYEALLDPRPDAPLDRPAGPSRGTERVPSDVELVLGALISVAGTPWRMARTAAHLARAAAGMVRLRASAEGGGVTFPFQAPRTSLNQPITSRRGLAFVSTPLEDVKTVKRAFGTTVGDVVLALCGGSLRRYLEARGELPDRPLVAQVPVAVRIGDTGDRRANAVSVMAAALGTHLADPVERLQAVQASTRSAALVHRSLGDDPVLEIARAAPPAVMAAGVRAYTRLRLSEHHPPAFNLIVSSVPGPRVPLYTAGARLVALYPMGPLLDGGGLNITAVSHADRMDLGFLVCPDVVPDPWTLADVIPDELETLRKAAERVAA
ncbi:MAG: wax ester/triacylglycerol synthase family O-acyltransferase [Acidimicrobiia bacterium]|nr:wax ester/triacylglycerol synthase family O-acyltransferase [Acidimicrobiia bacterium]